MFRVHLYMYTWRLWLLYFRFIQIRLRTSHEFKVYMIINRIGLTSHLLTSPHWSAAKIRGMNLDSRFLVLGSFRCLPANQRLSSWLGKAYRQWPCICAVQKFCGQLDRMVYVQKFLQPLFTKINLQWYSSSTETPVLKYTTLKALPLSWRFMFQIANSCG